MQANPANLSVMQRPNASSEILDGSSYTLFTARKNDKSKISQGQSNHQNFHDEKIFVTVKLNNHNQGNDSIINNLASFDSKVIPTKIQKI